MSSAPGIRYVEIGSSDLTRSLDFYQGVLGFRPVEREPWPAEPATCWLHAGAAYLKLVEVSDGDLGGWSADDLQCGIRHVGLKVGDVDARAERVRDAGVEFTLGPLDAHGGVRIAFFKDPDGAVLEFVEGHPAYDRTWSVDLAERERAAHAARPRDAAPTFDHIAVTAPDLAGTLAFFRDTMGYSVIGQLFFHDERGFVITYLQAGSSVLEVFTYSAATSPNPWTAGQARLGLRGLGIEVDDRSAARVIPAGAREIGPAVAGTLLAGPHGLPFVLLGRQ